MATSDTTSPGQAATLAEALAQIEQLRTQLAAEQDARSRLQNRLELAHEINTPIQYISDSVGFLRGAFDDMSKLFTSSREALTSLKSTHTTAAAQLAQLRDLEIECDFDFLSVEVPKAFERTLQGAERVTGIVRTMEESALPNGAELPPRPRAKGPPTVVGVSQAKP